MQHTYTITGMTCQGCAKKIEKALAKIESMTQIAVDLEKKELMLTMKDHVMLDELNKALEPLKKYKIHLQNDQIMNDPLPEKGLKTYWPLILVALYIVLGTLYLAWLKGDYSWMEWMPDFMGLFFLSFAFFKLLDLKGFAASYLSYDLPTKLWPTWGYIYPFVEVMLGGFYLFGLWPIWTNLITFLVMGVSIVGVIRSVVKKRKIQCACLGTGFNLPMSTVTIVEDTLMILMAGVMFWVNLIS